MLPTIACREFSKSAARALAWLICLTAPLTAQEEEVSLDLMFCMDGSGSIDAADFALQKEGLQKAIGNDDFVPRNGSTAFGLVQFAGTTTTVEVPLTVIETEADAAAISAMIGAITQIGGGTNPGDGVNTAWAVLKASPHMDAVQNICLSTDGTPNSGANIVTAVATAKSEGLNAFGVIGIRCPGIFEESDLKAVYGPLVFSAGGQGPGAAVFVGSSVEFANAVGAGCFGEPLKLIGMEIIQTVQSWENSVPLIAGKETHVRVHLEPLSPMVMETPAFARLRGFRAGSELLPRLVPSNPKGGQLIAKQDAVGRRADWDESMNFRLPSSWTQKGQLELFLEGYGVPIDCSMAAAVDQDCRVTREFVTTTKPRIKFYALEWNDNGVDRSPTTPADGVPNDLANLAERLVSIYPIAGLDWTWGEASVALIFNDSEDLDKVNLYLALLRVLNFDFSRKYYGVIRDDDTTRLEGLANDIPGTVASGYMQDDVAGRHTHSHEIGHLVGLCHVCACTAQAFVCGPAHAFVGGKAPIGPEDRGDEARMFGLATEGFGGDDPYVVSPTQHWEMMSYCGPDWFWISDLTYGLVRAGINSEFTMQMGGFARVNQAPALADDQLIVAGLLDLNSGSLSTWLPFHLLVSDQEPPAQPPGDYTLQMLDGGGVVVLEVPFEPDVMVEDPRVFVPDPRVSGLFILTVPFDRAYEAARILGPGGVQLGERSATDNSPEVMVIFPNGGEVLDGDEALFEWQASDLDGDPLIYSVQYSDDGGVTWDTLAVDYPQDTLLVNLGAIGGTVQGLVRVFASDGFHIASDQSDEFFVTDKPPTVVITSPPDGSEFFGIQTIYMTAVAEDVEDGSLSGDSLVWTSDLDGQLGTGSEVTVPANEMSEGQHLITVTAEDSAGNSVSDAVTISVDSIFEDDCIIANFDGDDFGQLVNGQVPAFESDFALEGSGPNFGPAVFDSDPNGPNQGSDDPDLLVDLGNVLILQGDKAQSQDGIFDNPNDAIGGGKLTFQFVEPVRVESMDLIDLCPGPGNQEGFVTLTDASGKKRVYHAPGGFTTDVTVSGLGYETLSTLTLADQPGAFASATATEESGFDQDQIVALEVEFGSSAALDNLKYCK